MTTVILSSRPVYVAAIRAGASPNEAYRMDNASRRFANRMALATYRATMRQRAKVGSQLDARA